MDSKQRLGTVHYLLRCSSFFREDIRDSPAELAVRYAGSISLVTGLFPYIPGTGTAAALPGAGVPGWRRDCSCPAILGKHLYYADNRFMYMLR